MRLEAIERIRETVEALAVEGAEHGDAVRLTVSAGVASMPAHADAAESLIATANDALYRANRAGKNRTVAAATEPSLS